MGWDGIGLGIGWGRDCAGLGMGCGRRWDMGGVGMGIGMGRGKWGRDGVCTELGVEGDGREMG